MQCFLSSCSEDRNNDDGRYPMKKCDDAKVTNRQTNQGKALKNQSRHSFQMQRHILFLSHIHSFIALSLSNATEDVFDGVGWAVKSVSRE